MVWHWNWMEGNDCFIIIIALITIKNHQQLSSEWWQLRVQSVNCARENFLENQRVNSLSLNLDSLIRPWTGLEGIDNDLIPNYGPTFNSYKSSFTVVVCWLWYNKMGTQFFFHFSIDQQFGTAQSTPYWMLNWSIPAPLWWWFLRDSNQLINSIHYSMITHERGASIMMHLNTDRVVALTVYDDHDSRAELRREPNAYLPQWRRSRIGGWMPIDDVHRFCPSLFSLATHRRRFARWRSLGRSSAPIIIHYFLIITIIISWFLRGRRALDCVFPQS